MTEQQAQLLLELTEAILDKQESIRSYLELVAGLLLYIWRALWFLAGWGLAMFVIKPKDGLLGGQRW